MHRRKLLGLSAAAVAAYACGGGGTTLPTVAPAPAPTARDELDEIAAKIRSGGPPPDGIPPVEEPRYISVAEASERWDEDAIIDAFTIDGQPRAYPRMITVWHEIVNETSADGPIAITYCPLTGSTIVFSGALEGGTTTTFGTSGQLYNSNLVMYDRATDSMWPQLLGTAVRGERKGERLREIPGAVTTTFGRWKAKYPTGTVLSTETGHVRPYGTSPYGSYDRDDRIIFPVENHDITYHRKKVVVGIRHKGGTLAIPKAEFAERRLANTELAGTPLVALYDPDLDAVRVFDRTTGQGPVGFAIRDGALVDEETGSHWSPEGQAELGPLAGTKLQQISAYDVMWFAWAAFNPYTNILE
ncbi:MAG: DUF3179 domain-containing protein [Acidimicrobiia bacterium]